MIDLIGQIIDPLIAVPAFMFGWMVGPWWVGALTIIGPGIVIGAVAGAATDSVNNHRVTARRASTA